MKVEMNASDDWTVEHGIGLLAVNHRRESGVGGLAQLLSVMLQIDPIDHGSAVIGQ
ncbi:MAG: hypothetical protein IPI72_04725 [Flavobacteriales bacterium]|jgi:hypothetical protein|nr:hypothetical protein [Flavobacteriales bacterium]MBK7101253.1 hypothetical protein [Flavobacteriales bacterium]MBK7482040.1 hypothetical protein [Flavobacteriales bacterium]